MVYHVTFVDVFVLINQNDGLVQDCSNSSALALLCIFKTMVDPLMYKVSRASYFSDSIFIDMETM